MPDTNHGPKRYCFSRARLFRKTLSRAENVTCSLGVSKTAVESGVPALETATVPDSTDTRMSPLSAEVCTLKLVPVTRTSTAPA